MNIYDINIVLEVWETHGMDAAIRVFDQILAEHKEKRE